MTILTPGDAGELYESFGYALAMRVLQSDLYKQLDDKERAECDELISLGQGKPSAQPAPAERVGERSDEARSGGFAKELDGLLSHLEGIQAGYETASATRSRKLDAERASCHLRIHNLFRTAREDGMEEAEQLVKQILNIVLKPDTCWHPVPIEGCEDCDPDNTYAAFRDSKKLRRIKRAIRAAQKARG